MTIELAFLKYKKFLETTDSSNLDGLEKFVSNEVIFRDPLHDVIGLESMANIFKQLFHKIDDVDYRIIDYAINNQDVFFNWELKGRLFKKPWRVDGVTNLKFNKGLKVSHQIEYWDVASGLYDYIPVIGTLTKFGKKIAKVN
tara:strand:- start:194 stop:619 length:426 start_codon:yes stop_codon:yes gene_type:complete